MEETMEVIFEEQHDVDNESVNMCTYPYCFECGAYCGERR